jgi:hypothetical protein
MFDKLCEPLNLTAIETRDSTSSYSKMEFYFQNLKGSPIFEDALLKLIRLDMEAFAAGTSHDVVLIE